MQEAATAQRPGSDFIRNFVFGVEDSLVSTVGLISGIAAAGVPRAGLLITGTVLVFVEAFSMAVGSLISDNSVREFTKHGAVPMRSSYGSSLVMFLSYFLSGFFVLSPYLFLPIGAAFIASIAASLLALFILGLYVGRLSGIPAVRRGLVVAGIGGAAIAIGVSVGMILDRFI